MNIRASCRSYGGLHLHTKLSCRTVEWQWPSNSKFRWEMPPSRLLTTSSALSASNSSSEARRRRSAHVRLNELKQTGIPLHPRLARDERAVSCAEFRKKYASLETGATKDEDLVVVRGRIKSIRIASSKLVFVDLEESEHPVQLLLSFKSLQESGVSKEQFKQFYHSISRGDIISSLGHPHRTLRSELSLSATCLPTLLSPCLNALPYLGTPLPSAKHISLLSCSRASHIFHVRSRIINALRTYLLSNSFTEVSTPILSSFSGGAVARPFLTSATEFPDRALALRIAPELWLKRLVVGGIDRVFEIGPCFRNEGIDALHNPEFTSCEFYRAYTTLDELIDITEDILRKTAESVQSETATVETDNSSLRPQLALPKLCFEFPFKRLDFLSTIQNALSTVLPPLASPSARADLIALFQNKNLPLPSSPTLPRLLDKLSTLYIEPLCVSPTFITHHPECLSPLSKSMPHSLLPDQQVAARAELFVNGRELANMYEEENSPLEQRRKFVEQLAHQSSSQSTEGKEEVDEAYLEALEWGLPPTGGWGCGIDRLVMLFTGTERIADVLSFGTLRGLTRGTKSEPEDE